MDDVVYYNILMSCKYNEFVTFSKTCKKAYRVARTIWKEWINNKFSTLFSFVNKKDNYKLLKILSHIMNGTLKDEVSVFVMFGSGCNGKSTLSQIFKRICPTFGNLTITRDFQGLSQFKNSLVFLAEMENNDDEIYGNLLHKIINLGFECRELFKAHQCINKPGVAVISTNKEISIKITGKEKAWSEELLPTVAWNGFANLPVVQQDTHEGKLPRYPLYLHLPYIFSTVIDDKLIINKCVNELNNYMK